MRELKEILGYGMIAVWMSEMQYEYFSNITLEFQ